MSKFIKRKFPKMLHSTLYKKKLNIRIRTNNNNNLGNKVCVLLYEENP